MLQEGSESIAGRLNSFVFRCVAPQEIVRQDEENKLAREVRRAEKAEKAERAKEQLWEQRQERQAATGLKKHKRGPSTAGTPQQRGTLCPALLLRNQQPQLRVAHGAQIARQLSHRAGRRWRWKRGQPHTMRPPLAAHAPTPHA